MDIIYIVVVLKNRASLRPLASIYRGESFELVDGNVINYE